MKNIFYKLMLVLMAMTMFQACEINDPEELGIIYNGDSFVSFYGASSASLTELIITPTDTAEGVTNIIVRSLGAEAVTVEFDFDTADINLPAIENVDYILLNTSKTLSFPAGGGEDTIRVKAIDNSVFDGGVRNVNINLISKSSDSYEWGTETTCKLSVMDDDHPLSLILGDYLVTGTDYWGGSLNHSITVEPVEGDVTKISITGLAMGGISGKSQPVVATPNLEDMTILIPVGQICYVDDTNPAKIQGFDGVTEADIEDGESISITITSLSPATWLINDIYGAMIYEGANIDRWFNLVSPGAQATKQ